MTFQGRADGSYLHELCNPHLLRISVETQEEMWGEMLLEDR